MLLLLLMHLVSTASAAVAAADVAAAVAAADVAAAVAALPIIAKK